MSLYQEQADWTARDWEVAAAVLGTACGHLMHILSALPDNVFGQHDAMMFATNSETARIAIRLAQDAAHCADRALTEAERTARLLGVSPFMNVPAYERYMDEKYSFVDDPRR